MLSSVRRRTWVVFSLLLGTAAGCSDSTDSALDAATDERVATADGRVKDSGAPGADQLVPPEDAKPPREASVDALQPDSTSGSCSDGVKNGDETDVDCGGSCPGKCVDGKGCKESTDCKIAFCHPTTLVCTVPSCTDTYQNGDEVDVDCGGSCPACDDGSKCVKDAGCKVGFCHPGTKLCTAPTCTDTYQNGKEVDVDCGGGCPGCADGKKCANGSDCMNGFCHPTTSLCATPLCTDKLTNGDETDADCGGSCPDKCAESKACKKSGDCQSGFCSPELLICAQISCSDGFKNGDETDVDCGGSCPEKCGDGKGCAKNVDCAGGFCTPGALTCSTPGCGDGFQNGSETDVDCGGTCQKCADTKTCLLPDDCSGGVCDSGTCKTCGAGFESKDGKSCVDLDECSVGLHDCDPKAVCINTSGSFACACPTAYRGDGKLCVLAVSEYGFTGAMQTWTAPVSGPVLLEVWGAQGGGTNGGKGGFSKGTLQVVKGETLYVFTGERPTGRVGGWNGGGSSYVYNNSAGKGGGGASDVRRGGETLTQRVIVAGGGGAGAGHVGGPGGGTSGGDGTCGSYSNIYCGRGGTQAAGGAGGTKYPCGSPNEPGANGSFGPGGDGGRSASIGWGDGGGGGYYGGGGAGGACTGSFSGGGGSGFIQYSLTDASTTSNVRSGHGLVRLTLP